MQRKLLCIPFITHKYQDAARDATDIIYFACTLSIMTLRMCQYLAAAKWDKQIIKMSRCAINCFFQMRACGKLQAKYYLPLKAPLCAQHSNTGIKYEEFLTSICSRVSCSLEFNSLWRQQRFFLLLLRFSYSKLEPNTELSIINFLMPINPV